MEVWRRRSLPQTIPLFTRRLHHHQWKHLTDHVDALHDCQPYFIEIVLCLSYVMLWYCPSTCPYFQFPKYNYVLCGQSSASLTDDLAWELGMAWDLTCNFWDPLRITRTAEATDSSTCSLFDVFSAVFGKILWLLVYTSVRIQRTKNVGTNVVLHGSPYSLYCMCLTVCLSAVSLSALLHLNDYRSSFLQLEQSGIFHRIFNNFCAILCLSLCIFELPIIVYKSCCCRISTESLHFLISILRSHAAVSWSLCDIKASCNLSYSRSVGF